MFRKLQRRPPALTFWAPLAHCPTPMTLEKGLQLSPWLLAKEDPKLCRLGPRGQCAIREAEHHWWARLKKPQNHL